MKKAKKIAKIIAGCLLIALTLNIFYIGTKIIPSGMFGFGIIYNSKFNMSLELIIFLTNIFFFVLAYIFIDYKSMKKMLIPFIIIPLFVLLTRKINTIIDIKDVDKLLLSLYGGVLMGLGFRLIYKEGAFASGSDVIMLITQEINRSKRNIINYVIDILWVIIGIFMYGFEGAMYSLISIAIMEVISRRATLGVSDAKVFYIITKCDREVKDYILNELKYELTIFDVKGGFLKTKNKVLMSVIPTKDYYKLREGVKLIDPNAFISITDSYEVINPNKSLKLAKEKIKNCIIEDLKNSETKILKKVSYFVLFNLPLNNFTKFYFCDIILLESSRYFMSKKNALIIIGVLLIVCFYILSKFFLFNYYDLRTYNDVFSKLNIEKTIDVSSSTSSEYLQFKNIKLNKELFADFKESNEKNTDKSASFVKNLDNGKIAYIRISYNDKGIVDSFMSEKDSEYEDMKLTKTYMTKYFKKHNIKNDNDLISYLTNDAKKIKIGIFSSFSKLKDSYVTKKLATRMLNTQDNISILNGDYEGYIYIPVSDHNAKEVNISHNGKRYILYLVNLEYFTEDTIKNILNSLIIE